METTKEKAEQLVEKFYNTEDEDGYHSMNKHRAKQCAKIAVDEILNTQPSYRYWDTYDDETPSAITFWQEVKTELNKL